MSNAQGGGATATATVVRGGNRTLEVRQKMVCPYPDGQIKYEVMLTGTVIIPAGDPLPFFVTSGWSTVTEPGAEIEPPPNQEHLDAIYARRKADSEARFDAMRQAASSPQPPPMNMRANVIVRDPEGNVKSRGTTEPIPLPADAPTPPFLVGVNTVVEARPTVRFPDKDSA